MATLTSLESTAARARTTLQALLPDAGRGAQRRGTRWTTRMMTVATTMEAEASKAGDVVVMAAEVSVGTSEDFTT